MDFETPESLLVKFGLVEFLDRVLQISVNLQEIRLTWLGGTTILKKIEKQNYNILTKRPKLNLWDALKLIPYAWFTK